MGNVGFGNVRVIVGHVLVCVFGIAIMNFM